MRLSGVFNESQKKKFLNSRLDTTRTNQMSADSPSQYQLTTQMRAAGDSHNLEIRITFTVVIDISDDDKNDFNFVENKLLICTT